MATATLELINPYAKYGLKRRPTYQEIIGLIGENETLTGKLPDRTATFYKASPEGSFFDGTDHLEVLKEQQQRIHERQMRELLLRQNVRNNGNTFNVDRIQALRRENAPPQPETPSSNDDLTDAQMQTELQQRATAYASRQQQTGEAHRGFLERATSMPILRSFLPFATDGARSAGGTPMHRNVPHIDLTRDDAEEEPIDEMATARGSTEDLILNSLRFRHPEATPKQLLDGVEVLNKYKDLTPEQIATNFSSFAILNNIFSELKRNGFITDDVYDEYLIITSEISSERGGRKRASLLRRLADHYRNHVYDLYIDDISNRPVGA